MTRRILLFVVICVGAVALPVSYGLFGPVASAPLTVREFAEVNDAAALASIQSRPHVVFINKQLGDGYGRLAVVPLDERDGPRYLTPLRCERVYLAGETGICLATATGPISSYVAHLFDGRFEIRQRVPLEGYPSRARVSSDGQRAVSTVFVRGDSYASGDLSTRTVLLDATTGQRLGDLEEFAAYRDGGRFQRVDFNYWGVTFSRDPDAFLATLASGRMLWLVKGHVGRREVHLIREGVECPSLSPDERRVAFKSRSTAAGVPTWQLRVLTLDSSTEAIIPETRSVDDQAAWIDEETVAFALREDDSSLAATGVTTVWSAPADGGGTPQVFLKYAYSPAVVTPPAPPALGRAGEGTRDRGIDSASTRAGR